MAASDGDPSGTAAAGDVSQCRFVNHLRFTLTLSEIRFELAWFGPKLPTLPVWCFATTPDHLLTMSRGFAAAVDSYQARYGRIQAVQVDPAAIRFGDGPSHG